MGKRRKSREIVVKLLYHKDINDASTKEILDRFWEKDPAGEDVMRFVEDVFLGVIAKGEELDENIKKYSKNWDINRLSIIDKCILRLSIYEILYRPDIPHNVSINEAIDIAKKYSNLDSGKFINGILDRVSKENAASQ